MKGEIDKLNQHIADINSRLHRMGQNGNTSDMLMVSKSIALQALVSARATQMDTENRYEQKIIVKVDGVFVQKVHIGGANTPTVQYSMDITDDIQLACRYPLDMSAYEKNRITKLAENQDVQFITVRVNPRTNLIYLTGEDMQ